jgi:hypothetical protein
MQLSELLSVGQEALGLLLLENYREPWRQLVEYMKQGESAIPSNVQLPSQGKVDKSRTEEDALEE